MTTMTDVGHGRGWLSPAAAASLRRVDQRRGAPMPTSELGRTRARQQLLWDLYFYPNGKVRPASQRPSWLGRPAPPGTSPHETGDAGDSNHWPGWEAEHGWIEDTPGEGWHRRYIAARDRYAGQPAGTITPEEDDLTPEQARMLAEIHRELVEQPGAGWTRAVILDTNARVKVLQANDEALAYTLDGKQVPADVSARQGGQRIGYWRRLGAWLRGQPAQ